VNFQRHEKPKWPAIFILRAVLETPLARHLPFATSPHTGQRGFRSGNPEVGFHFQINAAAMMTKK